ncbi:hypothetical protein PCASD_15618 [Puccinia coronata f. sp. avenae]|uniref:Uncharacterized protein n=1 Tax=Puccinia coronata f. sp. avenae TaxID=200324 RepID=A0A2N5TY65_9BASI|nr:hypothetical protein PCASD_15618 [Puccinia coronata f. sp. avenae]
MNYSDMYGMMTIAKMEKGYAGNQTQNRSQVHSPPSLWCLELPQLLHHQADPQHKLQPPLLRMGELPQDLDQQPQHHPHLPLGFQPDTSSLDKTMTEVIKMIEDTLNPDIKKTTGEEKGCANTSCLECLDQKTP